ncbi:MAG: hypothetical protein C4340_01290 [Armatimonadota bacterium]
MVSRERRLIEAVYRSTHKLAATTRMEETLHEVLHLCVEAVDASGGTVYIHDPVAKRLRFRHEVRERIVRGMAVSGWRKSAGSGWGTKIVSELATALGGRIEVDSELGKGTTFRVVLPMAPVPAKQSQGVRA